MRPALWGWGKTRLESRIKKLHPILITGRKPACTKCRANTYANNAGTKCEACPHNTESASGAYRIQQCVIPDRAQQTLFNYKDEYVNHWDILPRPAIPVFGVVDTAICVLEVVNTIRGTCTRHEGVMDSFHCINYLSVEYIFGQEVFF